MKLGEVKKVFSQFFEKISWGDLKGSKMTEKETEQGSEEEG